MSREDSKPHWSTRLQTEDCTTCTQVTKYFKQQLLFIVKKCLWIRNTRFIELQFHASGPCLSVFPSPVLYSHPTRVLFHLDTVIRTLWRQWLSKVTVQRLIRDHLNDISWQLVLRHVLASDRTSAARYTSVTPTSRGVREASTRVRTDDMLMTWIRPQTWYWYQGFHTCRDKTLLSLPCEYSCLSTNLTNLQREGRTQETSRL